MDKATYSLYCDELRKTVLVAGKKIMEIHDDHLGLTYKEDLSPVTLADKEAEKIIIGDLQKLAPDIPIIAEESVSDGNIPEIGNIFWLVDPLDGTKEFVAGGDEFTVNIALIENGRPVFGIIYAPALETLYFTTSADVSAIQRVSNFNILSNEQTITVRDVPHEGLKVLTSKSHKDTKTEQYIMKNDIKNIHAVGSSLKFCLIAAGDADIYPRFGPIMEWDSAAGHAILTAAGGSLTKPDGSPFLYGKPNFLNGSFIARGKTGS